MRVNIFNLERTIFMIKRSSLFILSALQVLTITWIAPSLSFAKPASMDPVFHQSWQIKNTRGVTVLPDIYYSDDIQNFQIMPMGLSQNQGRPLIDNIIYPTLGNPSLFIKCVESIVVKKCSEESKKDTFMTVLRLEHQIKVDLFKSSNAQSKDTKYTKLEFKSDQNANLTFKLINRHNNNEIFDIKPSEILVVNENLVPELLKSRDTLMFHFNQNDLTNVRPGLYDVVLKVKNKNSQTQYNALKIFDGEPQNKYRVINVTDTQVSLGKDLAFATKTKDRLLDFVKEVNLTQLNAKDEDKPAFIIFNGDLHNGGSPMNLNPIDVAYTYQKEAETIVDALKNLKVPIFLTPGNHDGYASTGVTPSFIDEITPDDQKINAIAKKVKPDFANDYANYLKKVTEMPGGKHLDIFEGVLIRQGEQDATKWVEVPKEHRNFMLYDGFNQWRKTYGPLYTAWTFKNNYYININSYDLRQHRRTGWGMYTVNYGGGISPLQMLWIYNEFTNAKRYHGQKDLILLSHHDPRGGHRGKDYPYYFTQVDYNGMAESLFNFVNGEMVKPTLCRSVPDSLMPHDLYLDCLHDGLQEWMRADSEYDCSEEFKVINPRTKLTWDKTCNVALFNQSIVDVNTECAKPDADIQNCSQDAIANRNKLHPRYSGYELIHHITKFQNLETILLGHTHYHNFEKFKNGDQLVGVEVILDKLTQNNYDYDDGIGNDMFKSEQVNPLRIVGKDKNNELPKLEKGESEESFFSRVKSAIFKIVTNNISKLVSENKFLALNLEKAGHTFNRVVEGEGRNLVIMRMTCASDLSDQKVNTGTMMGFTIFEVNKTANKSKEQINKVIYYQNSHAHDNLGKSVNVERLSNQDEIGFQQLGEFNIDRQSSFDDNLESFKRALGLE